MDHEKLKEIAQINTTTGEILDGKFVFIPTKKLSPFKGHMTMNLDENYLFALTKLTNEQKNVLFVLWAHLDYENFILVSQKTISEVLGIAQSNVSRAIKALVEHGVILEGKKIGYIKSYMLNPNFGWRGSVSNHKKALKHGFSLIEGGKA